MVNMKLFDIVSQWDDPLFKDMLINFGIKLTNESERGAILIGCGEIENYLTDVIKTIIPVKTKTFENYLLTYPGSLSSFSSKIVLLYTFRIVDKKLYDSLNILRKIRNNAAHSSDDFELQKYEADLDKIFSIDENEPKFLQDVAEMHLMDLKLRNINKKNFRT